MPARRSKQVSAYRHQRQSSDLRRCPPGNRPILRRVLGDSWPTLRYLADKLGRLPQRSIDGPVQVHPYRWRPSGSFLAHLFKAATQQHHRALAPTIARLVPAVAVVFDIGAHAGQYTKLFARAAGCGRVYAFEPGSYARSILRTIVWLHGLSNVAVIPIALGSEARIDTLTIPLKHRGSFGFGLAHLGKPSERWQTVTQEIVAVATIDGMVQRLGLDRLDFVKADIEGWELQLLRGAERALERFRPRLLLELNDTALARAGDRLDDAFNFLAARGYQGFCFAPEAGLVPLIRVEDGDFWFIPAEDSVMNLTADGDPQS
jgi:FkbM family methyltransferase